MNSPRRASFASHHLGRPWWRSLFAFVLLLSVVALTGCSSSSGSSGGGGSTPTLKSVYIAEASATSKEITALSMYTHEKAELCLMGNYSDGSCTEVSGTWTSSDSAKASVADGTVSAVAAGTATITAKEKGGKSATVSVTVKEVTLESVKILDEDDKDVTSGTLELKEGTNVMLSAVGTYSDGSTKDVAATWQSSDATKASVGASTGIVKGEKEGDAKITASAGDKSAYVNVKVKYVALKSVQINTESGTAKKNISMFVGEDMMFAAKGTFADGDKARLNDISWSTSGDAIRVGEATKAKVQAKALSASNDAEEYGVTTVTASQPGEAKLMAIDASTGMSSEVNVVVTDSDIDVITILPWSCDGTIAKGQTISYSFRALATMEDGQSVNISSVATWKSSNTGIVKVSVNSDGYASVQGVSAGTAGITCTYNGVTSKAYAVTVVDIDELTMVDSLTVYPGSAAAIYATAILKDGSSIEIWYDGIWTTSDPSKAIVYDNTVYGLALGEATVKCTFGGLTASCKVSVVNPPTVESITLVPTELTIAEGDGAVIEAYATLSDETTIPITDVAEWASDNTEIAIVDKGGEVIGVTAGTATITCEYEGQTATCAVTVTEPATVESIALSPNEMTMVQGSTTEEGLSAMAVLSDGSERVLESDEVIWMTDDSEVAIVDEYGRVTGVGNGECGIYCEYADGEAIVTSESCAVTVQGIQSIAIVPSKARVVKGVAYYLKAVATLDNQETIELHGANWYSDNTDVAIVTDCIDSGEVTGVSEGTANITCECGGVTSSPCAVNVVEIESVSIPESMFIAEGDSEYVFTVDVTYSDGTTEEVTSYDATWFSNDAGVAIYNQSAVYGVGCGVTDIWCSFNGVESNLCTVTVKAVESITVPESLFISKGEYADIDVIVTYTDSSSEALPYVGSVKTDSDEPDVAFAEWLRSSRWEVYGNLAGEANVWFTWGGVSSNKCTVTVTE